jgi:hypothetical protein
MNVKATVSGEACEADIKPLASTVMPSETAKEVMDEIVPEIKRGKINARFHVNGGCTGIDVSGYEKVTIILVTRCAEAGRGTYSARIQWLRGQAVLPERDRAARRRLGRRGNFPARDFQEGGRPRSVRHSDRPEVGRKRP